MVFCIYLVLLLIIGFIKIRLSVRGGIVVGVNGLRIGCWAIRTTSPLLYISNRFTILVFTTEIIISIDISKRLVERYVNIHFLWFISSWLLLLLRRIIKELLISVVWRGWSVVDNGRLLILSGTSLSQLQIVLFEERIHPIWRESCIIYLLSCVVFIHAFTVLSFWILLLGLIVVTNWRLIAIWNCHWFIEMKIYVTRRIADTFYMSSRIFLLMRRRFGKLWGRTSCII